MITIEYVREKLDASGISNAYAQKFVDMANGNIDKLDELLSQKLAERRIRPAIRHIKE